VASKEKSMSNNTKPQLIIDGVEYDTDELTDQQKAFLNHVVDLERKVSSAKFNLDQLTVGRDTFFGMLRQSLTAPAVKAAEIIAE
jgi:hypothetical protein